MQNSDILNSINEMLIFKELSTESQEELIEKGSIQEFGKYDSIYSIGEPVNRIYFLLEGMVKIASLSKDGKEVIKFLLHQPATFGEQGVLGEDERDEYAVAISQEVKVLVIQLSEFQNILEKYPHFAFGVINFLARKVRMVEKRLETQIFMNARDRIIDFIREAACKRGQKIGYERLLKRNLTQQEIANYTGTSRQTVTEVFNELKKANLIHFSRNKILIRDSFKLVCD